jgi:pectate lyase
MLKCRVANLIGVGSAALIALLLPLLMAAAGTVLSGRLTSSDNQEHDNPSPKLPDGRQRAFPTAEGFGAAAVGGRGGRIFYVTTVKESGPGTLRECIEAAGPRNCVFRVAGTIILDDAPLIIRNPFITIAGETAPGGGIAIRNSKRQPRPSVSIETNDVIIRHIRIRPGPHAVEACCSGALGLYTKAATNIMLDHLSVSWGSDETVDSEDATNITLQWALVGEPLLNGGPGKRNRARNALFTKGGNITVHHSLFVHGQFRNPQIKMAVPGAVADVVNNVLFSPQWQYVITLGDEWTKINANIVGNYKVAGKKITSDRLVHLMPESGKGFSVYLSDNVDETYRTDEHQREDAALEPQFRRYIVAEPFTVPAVRTTSPERAYLDVLENAGATKPKRDAVDERLVRQVRNRSGKLLESDPEKVGGWPELADGAAYPDGDKDGIDDGWEKRSGLDPTNPQDGAADKDGDGWTNFEEFTHELAGDDQALVTSRPVSKEAPPD